MPDKPDAIIRIHPASKARIAKIFRPGSPEWRNYCDAVTASFDDVFELAAKIAERVVSSIDDWQNASKSVVTGKVVAAIHDLGHTRNVAIVADASRVAAQEIYAIEWWPAPQATVAGRVSAAIRRMKLS